MPARTLLIALDSVEPHLMQQWMAGGHLPTLARLYGDGRSHPICNFHGYGNGTYWPSFNTGKLPSEHGRFFNRQLVPGTYRMAPFDILRDFTVEPFWTRIANQGGRVAVIDATRTGMGVVRQGLEITNWLAHDADGPTVTQPAALAGELRARFGEDPLAMGSDRYLRRNPNIESFVRILRDRATWKTTWCSEQLRASNWDLFYVTFGEAHDIGHLAWHIHDETHPEHDPGQRESLGDPVLAIYRHLDSCVDALVSTAGPHASVVIVIGPGMERNASGNHLLDTILQRLQRTTQSNTQRPAQTSEMRRAYAIGVPKPIKTALKRLRDYMIGSAEERERARSLFFVVPCNDNAGAIRINLVGREPKGRVAEGEAYERTITELCDALAAIHDSAGRPAVSNFVRNPIKDTAGRSTALPDLLAIWNRECDFTCLSSPQIGRIESSMRRERTGDHTDLGEIVLPKSRLDFAASSGTLDPAIAGRLLENFVDAGFAPTRPNR